MSPSQCSLCRLVSSHGKKLCSMWSAPIAPECSNPPARSPPRSELCPPDRPRERRFRDDSLSARALKRNLFLATASRRPRPLPHRPASSPNFESATVTVTVRCFRCFRPRLLRLRLRLRLLLLLRLLDDRLELRLRCFRRFLRRFRRRFLSRDLDSDEDEPSLDADRLPSRLSSRLLRLLPLPPSRLPLLLLLSRRLSRLRARLSASFRSRRVSRSLSLRFFSASSIWYLSTIDRLPHERFTPG